jgi:hypothetical protein
MMSIIFVGLLPVIGCIILLNAPLNIELATLLLEQTVAINYALATWLHLTTMAAALAWTNYLLDLWVITDRRIIVIEQVAFFNRKVGNFRLERMQDIKVTISGIIPTLLNYGTLKAQTASAAESNFTSPYLPDPRGLQALIQTAMDDRLKSLGTTPRPAD